ncbi:hypothetical protein LTR17_015491 [Elasticomyces elasticus]|nr:hypothetical protein LTR17_015491 [Elasticomyces elasticus]
MAPSTPEELLERHAAALAGDLLASRALARRYRSIQRPIMGVISQAAVGPLQRFDALANAVFTTYELLEMILLHLPMRGLLLASGVNKAFHDLINRSQAIQRALCMQAGKLQATEDDPVPDWNVMLCDNSLQLGPWSYREDEPCMPACNYPGKGELEIFYFLDDHHFSRAQPLPPADSPKAEFIEAGSWQKMYLTWNTYQSVGVTLFHQGEETPWSHHVFDDGQVTMGELQETMRTMFNSTIASDRWPEYVDHGHACAARGCSPCIAAEEALTERYAIEEARRQRAALEAEQASDEIAEDSETGSEGDSETGGEDEDGEDSVEGSEK